MIRPPRLVISGSALLATLIAAASQANAAVLAFEGPASCPSRETVERRLSDTLAMPLERAADLRFSCNVKETRQAFRLELRVESGDARPRTKGRIFEARTCDRVVDAAVVAMALALGAKGVEPTQEQAAMSPANEAVTATDQPPNQSEVAPQPPTRDSSQKPARVSDVGLWFGAARFGPTFDFGSLPGIALGPQAQAELGYGILSARLALLVFGSKQRMLNDGSGGEFSLWTGALSTCATTPRQKAHGVFCLGLELGRMGGEGTGALRTSRQGSAWWLTPKFDVELTSGPFLFGLRTFVGATAGIPLERRPFTLGQKDEVHRANSVIWRLNAGLEIDWQ